ncbi:MAG: M20 family metallo-hydrolase [Acidihalobacter sp.]|uniref:M20 family metallo-hydrolase n=1 Tax=Acidihalobacter sp. TaxID=1872108 RepID=UPI00307E84C1
MNALGEEILQRLDQAAACSEPGAGVTRFSFTAEHRAVGALIEGWMQRAGLETHWDDAGNLVGRLEGEGSDHRTLIFGSHQDSVRSGGRYDGMLGIVLPLVCLEALREQGAALPYPVEVIAFSDEEGGRFTTSLVGSKAVAGGFDAEVLAMEDADGVSLERALREFGADPGGIPALARRPEDVRAFVEVHIEQGPVLETAGQAVGVVTALTGIERHRLMLKGKASHAGTTPMESRRDALVGAAGIVLELDRVCRETHDCVGVVGELEVVPNVVNVIPAQVRLTLELRSPEDAIRVDARKRILGEARRIAEAHGLGLDDALVYEQSAVSCAPWLIGELGEAVADATGERPRELFSGAGHDGLAMAGLTDIGMLFVRTPDGLSHHPDEALAAEDAGVAASVVLSLLRRFAAACR